MGSFHGFEPQCRFDQSLDFAVIGFNAIVEILILAVRNILRAFVFFFQFPNCFAISTALSVFKAEGFSQSLNPRSALPRKRLAALLLRVPER